VRVLVIGGTRFVGRLLVFRLLARGDRVTLFNRGTIDDPFGERVERIRGDRTKDLGVLAGRRFDAVVDTAAYDRPDVEGAIATFAGNVGRYLFVSTGSTYLVRADLEPPFRESDYEGPTKPRPTSEEELPGWEYGMGKRACEDLLAARTDFPSTRLRIPNVHGPRDYYRRMENIVHRILDGGPILCEEPERRIRHVDATDVARTIVELIEHPRAEGEAYNQTHDETPTNAEVIAMLAREIGATPRIVQMSAERMRAAGLDPSAAFPFRGSMSFLDPAKIRALGIGHAPLAHTIAKVVAELLAHVHEPPEDYRAQRDKELAASERA
jgi:nucleoside-diphosphate-sugar epimerase